MVLFFLNKILKNKYKNFKKNKIISWEEFKEKNILEIIKIFPKYFYYINEDYIKILLNDYNNQIIFYSMDAVFSIENITSILIYHKTISSNIIKYYLLLLGTHCEFRNLGYGKLFLDEFIEWINKLNIINKQTKIILKSIESSIGFYINYGFVKAENNSNKLFFKYEPRKEFNNNNIFELIIN